MYLNSRNCGNRIICSMSLRDTDALKAFEVHEVVNELTGKPESGR